MDIAGQDRSSKITKMFIKGSHDAVVLYDITNMNTRKE